jgi:hypothetical protein
VISEVRLRVAALLAKPASYSAGILSVTCDVLSDPVSRSLYSNNEKGVPPSHRGLFEAAKTKDPVGQPIRIQQRLADCLVQCDVIRAWHYIVKCNRLCNGIAQRSMADKNMSFEPLHGVAPPIDRR